MDLSIIIINYNTKKLTKECIHSVIESTHMDEYEIIVVDNSTDEGEKYEVSNDEKGIVKLFPEVENKGFGSACNFGARMSKGKYLLFLNSDTIVKDEAIDKCINYLKNHSEVGVLGIRTLLPDGKLDHGCKRGFPTPSASLYYFLGFDKRHPENKKYGAYRQTFIDEHETSEVDSVSGAFMMIPKEVYNEVSGFDEDYFMYGEDIDICYRIKKIGHKVIYFADAYIIHLKGQSGLSTKSKQIIYHFYNSMKLFYKKHYEQEYNFLTNKAVYAGIKLKHFISAKGKPYRRL